MKIRSQKDFAAGLLFAVTGAAFAIGAVTYDVGSAARMGPGYFPLILGALLAIIGVIVALTALGREPDPDEHIGRIAWRPLVFILGANIAFGVLLGGLPSIGLPPFGLIVAIVALTFIASLASGTFHWKEVAVTAAVLAAGSYLVFNVALNLQMPVWPWFI